MFKPNRIIINYGFNKPTHKKVVKRIKTVVKNNCKN